VCPLLAAALLASAAARAQTSPLVRGLQSLNPDISAIVDVSGGLQSAGPGFGAGDDPVLAQNPAGRALGFTVQEIEVALSAVVDPYLKGEVYLTIPNLGGVEVEEAVATTTSLPWNLQLRAGSFRSAFGRQNGQHLHVQDFTMRPLVNAAFLGTDGLRGPGAQVSWLLPLPVFLTLYLEGYSLPVVRYAPTTFGGDNAGLVGLAHAKLFVEATDELSLSLGLSSALGRSPTALLHTLDGGPSSLEPVGDTALFGADAYLKWKPANQANGYLSAAWQTELLLRRRAASGGLDASWDGGLYSQVVLQLARRLVLGLRLDLLGLPTSLLMPRVVRGTAALTFQLSEFARARLSAYGERTGAYAADPRFVAPDDLPTANRDALGVLAQLEISIGAHGAHAF
jgi:hypothetical protein